MNQTGNFYRYSLDIVKTAWVEAQLERLGDPFEWQYFTAAERQMSQTSKNRIEYLASRFAAKAAVLKVLRIDQNSHSLWHDIEIQRLPSGEPIVVLGARCLELATERNLIKWLLSLSHTASYATASAIALVGRKNILI
ncbi:MAG: holo-ACP synthase [Aphanocapsa sp. GSE-SYN-MK-11-07L]|nr:holo-ACP synthase [Aphanocapsa sp. GSE-SYN-MK-11-07L]